jgi:UDP-N-acetyl-D-mannosaminuronate dehydrogenase
MGLRYVGMPLAVEFGNVCIRTLGIDVNQARVDPLNVGDNYIHSHNRLLKYQTH